jgi:hypothetical protein
VDVLEMRRLVDYLPEVDVELHVENQEEHVWTYRTFHAPAGDLCDEIQWARPNIGYGDGPDAGAEDSGRVRNIIPMAVEAGVDVSGGLQPPNVGDVGLRDVKARFGRQVALLGGLDPVYTFDLGDAEVVRAAVRQAIADAGAGGGYVLGTGEAVAPHAPRESLIAASQTARNFGVCGRDL